MWELHNVDSEEGLMVQPIHAIPQFFSQVRNIHRGPTLVSHKGHIASSRIAPTSGAKNSDNRGSPRSRKGKDFVPLGKKDFPIFYRQFLLSRPEPVFIDIYDPPPFPTLKQFIAYFSVDRFWILGEPSLPTAYFALHDFQREHSLANLDFVYFDGYPVPNSTQAHTFWNFVRQRAEEYGLTRIQSFVLATSADKIRLLESFGFRKEGMLREHMLHNGKLHDVSVHAWMAEGRGG